MGTSAEPSERPSGPEAPGEVRLAREPQRLQARVEGLVVEATTPVVAEDRAGLLGGGRYLGDVQANGLGLGEAGRGGGQQERETDDAADQPWVPVRAT